MADVEFDEQIDPPYLQSADWKIKQSFLVRLTIKLRLAKDEKGANKVFIAISIFSIIFAIGIFLYFVLGFNPFAVTVAPRNQNSDYSLPLGPGTPDSSN